MYKALFFAILLVTDICFAKVIGHIEPLNEELLENPVTLECGVTILENIEIRNNHLVKLELTSKDIEILNVICSRVKYNYSIFLKDNGIKTPDLSREFHWKASLIPDTNNYRCLNDTRYRFYNRKIIDEGDVEVDGFTDKYRGYTFSLSNRNSKFFKTVFAHEIFHAMSIFYGINDSEELAEDFTSRLGYGR